MKKRGIDREVVVLLISTLITIASWVVLRYIELMSKLRCLQMLKTPNKLIQI
jgi:hypothetical protein